MYQELSAPVSCQIELTTACNLNCFHCYNHWRHGDCIKDTKMSEETLDKIVDQIVESGVMHITLTGGEPFMNKQVLFRAVEKITANGIVCDINSNITLITQEDAERLVSHGIGGVLTSFASYNKEKHDEITQVSGSFEKTIKGIKIAQDAGLTVAGSMVVTTLNMADVVETGKFLKSIGVTQFYVTKASPPVNSIEFGKYLLSHMDLIILLDSMKVLIDEYGMDVGALECYPLCSYHNQPKYSFMADRRCSAGVTTCSISANGDVRACSHDSVVYGNIGDEGLVGAWKNMSDWRSGALLPDKCKVCEFFSQCSGGCRVDSEYANGNKCTLDPYAIPESLADIVLDERGLEVEDLTEKTLEITEPLYHRKEEFCVLCSSQARIASPVTLSFDTFDLLKDFQGAGFTVKDIACYTELSESDANRLCSALYKDGLVKEKR